MNDAVIEPIELFNIVLSDLSSSLVSFEKNEATATILDDDATIGVSGLTIADVSVDEHTGVADFTVTLKDAIHEPITVDFITKDQSAVSSDDYVSGSGTIEFEGHDRESKTISVEIKDDNLIEPSETFLIELSSLSTDLIEINDELSIGTIVDNDIVEGETGLSIADVEINEDEGVAEFVVQLNGALQDGITVDFTTANGSAINDSDYSLMNGTLHFEGELNESKTISVPILDDGIIEREERFTVTLSNSSSSLVPINKPVGEGIIIDNDFIDGYSGLKLWAGGVSGTYSNQTISTNSWYHLVLILNGNSTKYYINGQFVGEGNADTVASTFNPNPEFIIGAGRAKTNQFFKGRIDDIRVYCRALTIEQIEKFYNE